MRIGLRKRVWWSLLLLPIGFFVYTSVLEPRNVMLTTYHVEIPNLPAELDGFRVVHLSDIHRRKYVPDSVIEKAVRMANATGADAAVLTGDYVSRYRKDIEPCTRLLSKLETRLGSYAVLGNHDHWTDGPAVSESLTRNGITVLHNANVKLGDGLYLAGIDDQWAGSPDGKAALRGVGETDACVMLSHTPKGWGHFKGRRGLLLTGHTHGGQAIVPGIPRNRLPGLLGWKYISGWYREGDILLYVNRGVGTVNPPVRFLCRPEVTLYVLHPSSDGLARVNAQVK